MVLSSLIACIKMGMSLTNPKQQAAIPFFEYTKILHNNAGINGQHCSAAGVVLPIYGGLNYRYGGLNYVRGINEVLKKKKNVTLHNFVQCLCKHIEQKCFIYHQMCHSV